MHSRTEKDTLHCPGFIAFILAQEKGWISSNVEIDATEIMNNLIGKGDEIAIEGKLTHRSYEKDGETRYSTEVVVNEFLLLNSVNQK